ncbi:MAG: hypothetical protein R3A48_28790, partial [Polyangiales bacterium]
SAMTVAQLARLRARLRPFSEGSVEARTRARDFAEISLATRPEPRIDPRDALAGLAALVAVCATAAALLSGGDTSRLALMQLWHTPRLEAGLP